MSRDILFKTEDMVFSLRVSGVLRQGERILLQCPAGSEEYAAIGGHISTMETAAETLVREFQEELHADIAVDELLCVGENFFRWGARPCHQICFFYNVHLKKPEQLPQEDVFQGYDDFGNRREDLHYVWVPLKQIENGQQIYPMEVAPFLLVEKPLPGYFLSRNL